MSNLERMLQLATEVFDVKNDDNQLDVNEEVLEKLRLIHSNTVSEFNDENGPVIWLIAIPTTIELMELFVDSKITERELLDLTPVNSLYQVLYLCSALVLPEYRRQGKTLQMALTAINNIKKEHPIKYLFVWSFSKEGDALAQKISSITQLPLLRRK